MSFVAPHFWPCPRQPVWPVISSFIPAMHSALQPGVCRGRSYLYRSALPPCCREAGRVAATAAGGAVGAVRGAALFPGPLAADVVPARGLAVAVHHHRAGAGAAADGAPALSADRPVQVSQAALRPPVSGRTQG